MSKGFEELAKDLAKGVSRREAFSRFMAGIGGGLGLAVTASAQTKNCGPTCREYANYIKNLCLSRAQLCEGSCPKLGFTLNGNQIKVNGKTYDYFNCVQHG